MSYLREKMTQDEEIQFQEDLQKNPEFKDKAISMARLAKGMTEAGTSKDKDLKEAFLASDEAAIRNIAKKAVEVSNTTGSGNSFRKYATILSIAASLIFIIYFGFLYHEYSKTTSLGETYAARYDKSIMRGEENPRVEKEINELVDNVYFNRDLNKTLKRLAVLWEVSTQDTYNDFTNFAPEIGWALATGYLKDNNKEEAMTIISRMAEIYDANTIIGKRARALQKSILQI